MKNLLFAADCARKSCNDSFASNQSNGIEAKALLAGGNIVFCKIDYVLHLFEKLRLTRNRIVLVTGEGDLPCDEFRQRYIPENVVRWFATNVTSPHPRVTALPLGIGSESDPVTLSGDQIVSGRYQVFSREKWLYVNFRPQTNPSVRQPVFDHFARFSESHSWVTMEKGES